MKKIFRLFLIVIFIIANSPMAVSFHWCGGKLTYFGTINHTEPKCSCGMEMPAGCCKDVELQANSLTDDYHSRVTKLIYSKIWKVTEFSILEFQNLFHRYPLKLKASLSFHPPPCHIKAPAFLLFCNFLV